MLNQRRTLLRSDVLSRTIAALITGACAMNTAAADDDAAAADSEPLTSVVVTGTRSETTITKSLAPIQVVNGEALAQTGTTDLRSALTNLVPAYLNVPGNGHSASKPVRTASLRGLAGNHVLVLVNGQRRHNTSLINNTSGSSLGSAPVDLALIPVGAVERIEVLTDGASAQYGSDAIAGVINVILRSSSTGWSFDSQYGQYNHEVSKVGGLGDAGESININGNGGFSLGDNGGFLNVAASLYYVGESNVTGPLPPPTKPIWQIYAAPGDPREATANRQLKSSTDSVPEQHAAHVSYNLALPLANDRELYSFSTISRRIAFSKGTYRTETNATALVWATPGGYIPKLETSEIDFQTNVGLRGEDFFGWSWDAGISYGRNRAEMTVRDTLNASFGGALDLPAINRTGDLYIGKLTFDEAIVSFDLKRSFETGLFDFPLNVAAGVEYRRNEFTQGAGEYYSYASGGYIFPDDYPAVNLRGVAAGAGSAFMSGFSPDQAGSYSRHNEAVYIDFSQKVTDRWDVSLAGRFEDYSDFGTAVAGKLSTRFQILPSIAVRGTFSTGFRAPSLQEQFYVNTNIGPTIDPILNKAYLTYSYNSISPSAPVAVALGATPLDAEKSTNVSIGFVLTPLPNLTASLDFYQIDISDRIWLTSAFNGFNNPAVAAVLAAAGFTTEQSVQYFTNIGDTRSRGLDFKLDATNDLGTWGVLNWGLSYALNKQSFTYIKPARPELAAAGLRLLNRDRIVLLEEGLPQHVAKLNLNWTIGQLDLRLIETYYSNTRVVNNVLNPAQDGISPPAFITDASVGWHATDNFTVTVGSNNLFNKRPANLPDSLLETSLTLNPRPVSVTPYGFGGALYYVRASYNW